MDDKAQDPKQIKDLTTAISVGDAIEQVLLKGDLASLTTEQRLSYYSAVCESVGLNRLTRPFEYITLNNKLVLYATKACTDQLRSVHKISIEIVSREKVGDVYVVTARAKDPSGRLDESTGAVALGRASGDALANLYMKAETKAKRRVTLSICGLALLDETEVETIPNAVRQDPGFETRAVATHIIPESSELPEASPEEEVSSDPANYRIQFGQYGKEGGTRLRDINPVKLSQVYEFCKNEKRLKGPKHLEFYEAYEQYIQRSDPKDEPEVSSGLEDIPF